MGTSIKRPPLWYGHFALSFRCEIRLYMLICKSKRKRANNISIYKWINTFLINIYWVAVVITAWMKKVLQQFTMRIAKKITVVVYRSTKRPVEIVWHKIFSNMRFSKRINLVYLSINCYNLLTIVCQFSLINNILHSFLHESSIFLLLYAISTNNVACWAQ